MSEFSPSCCASQIRAALSQSADAQYRDTIKSLHAYYSEYLLVTWHKDGNRPSQMSDGSVVYYSWQMDTMASFYCQVYAMALNLRDDNDHERRCAQEEWRKTDWSALHKEYRDRARSEKPIAR